LRAAVGPVSTWADRHGVWLIAVLALWFLVVLVGTARVKSFWHDEIYTILTAQLSIGREWRAHLDGVDFSPPLNTLLTRPAQAVAGAGPVVSRLPALLGYTVATLALFAAVRSRTNTITGLLAAAIPTATPAWNYAVEARGYGLSFGLFALTLYAWSQAAVGRRPRLHWCVMAGAIASGLWTHYYAVLFCVPIVAAELTRQASMRRLDPWPWLAMAAAALAAIPLLPLIEVSRAHSQTFWARPGTQTLGAVYAYVFKDLSSHLLVAGLLAVLIVWALFDRRVGSSRRLSAADLAAALGCLAVPAAGFLFGHLTHVFTLRYLVFATAGLAFALPLLLWRWLPDDGLGELAAVVALVFPLISITVETFRQSPWPPVLEERRLLADALRGADPVVIPWGVDYLTLWYSLPVGYRRQALYLADPDGQLRAAGSDTIDRGYLALARWTPVPVQPMGDFLRVHRHFVAYTQEGDWDPDWLVVRGASVVEVAREPAGTGVLYAVSLPDR
jgi:hypothetical protein